MGAEASRPEDDSSWFEQEIKKMQAKPQSVETVDAIVEYDGSQGGLGFVLETFGTSHEDEQPYVGLLTPGGAAARAGTLRQGDKILSIGGQPVRTQAQVVEAVRRAGDRVCFTLERRATAKRGRPMEQAIAQLASAYATRGEPPKVGAPEVTPARTPTIASEPSSASSRMSQRDAGEVAKAEEEVEGVDEGPTTGRTQLVVEDGSMSSGEAADDTPPLAAEATDAAASPPSPAVAPAQQEAEKSSDKEPTFSYRRAIFAEHIKSMERFVTRTPPTPPSGGGGWKGKRYEAVKTNKDVYKMGRYDVVTTQLHGTAVVKPDAVAGISYYRGIDEELAEAESLSA